MTGQCRHDDSIRIEFVFPRHLSEGEMMGIESSLGIEWLMRGSVIRVILWAINYNEEFLNCLFPLRLAPPIIDLWKIDLKK